MNSNHQKKSTILVVIAIIFVVTFIAACQQTRSSSSESETEPGREPKTSFGHAIKETKDLSEDLNKRDDQIAEQADELLRNN
jgi:flagellar basal body-associated protein FliL